MKNVFSRNKIDEFGPGLSRRVGYRKDSLEVCWSNKTQLKAKM